jgi:predicted sugar kinase
MLPALVERDLDSFGEAVYEFNRGAGELFRPWQDGVYSHPRVKEIVELLRRVGVRGVGQSSWGPTVFGIVKTTDETQMATRVRSAVTNVEVLATSADNQSEKDRSRQQRLERECAQLDPELEKRFAKGEGLDKDVQQWPEF